MIEIVKKKNNKKKKHVNNNLDVHSSVYLKSHSMYLSVAKEAAYNNKVPCDVKV